MCVTAISDVWHMARSCMQYICIARHGGASDRYLSVRLLRKLACDGNNIGAVWRLVSICVAHGSPTLGRQSPCHILLYVLRTYVPSQCVCNDVCVRFRPISPSFEHEKYLPAVGYLPFFRVCYKSTENGGDELLHRLPVGVVCSLEKES